MVLSKIYRVHVADGFVDDCDVLVRKCIEGGQKVSYPSFSEIWKDMNMGCYYEGRTSCAEIAELSEEVIHVAKQFMLVKSDNFEEVVAGLFLVYAVVNIQPYPKFAKLRICPSDINIIETIETKARNEKRLDILYILGSLLTEAQFHVESRERGMEWPLRKYFEGHGHIHHPRSLGVFQRKNKLQESFNELIDLSHKYLQSKMLFNDFKQCRSLSLFDATFPSKIQETFNKLTCENEWLPDGRAPDIVNADESPKQSESRTTHMANIKRKAMKATVSPVKYLQGIKQKTQEEKDGRNSDCEYIQEHSNPQPQTDIQKRKGSPKGKEPMKKLKANFMYTSTASQSKLNDSKPEETQKVGSQVKLELKNESEGLLNANEEISDNVLPDLSDAVLPNPNSITTQCNHLSSSTTEDTVNKSISTKVQDEKTTSDLVSVVKNNKAKKKYDKKRIIKSKFKKMGMLSMANFTDDSI